MAAGIHGEFMHSVVRAKLFMRCDIHLFQFGSADACAGLQAHPSGVDRRAAACLTHAQRTQPSTARRIVWSAQPGLANSLRILSLDICLLFEECHSLRRCAFCRRSARALFS